MSDKVEYSRLLLKRSNTAGVVPTIPPVSATTLNQFTPTDLFVGEMFVNVEDDRAWVRTNNDIIEFNFTGGTSGSTVIPTLTQVLNSGNTTGGFDILFPSGSKPVYTGLASGATTQFLGLDADGATIIVTGSTGGSGTSGTSGVDGTSGSSGINGTNGTSGSSGISGAGSDGTIYGRWQFSSGSTAWSNPGTARVITNSTNPNSVTRISIADTAQSSIYYGQLFDVIQSSYNSGASLLIQFQEIGSTNEPIIFTVGSMTGDTSWRNFGVAISVLGASAFNNNAIYSVSFEIYGQTGASGTSGSSGTSGVNGTSGSSGTSGVNGTSGSSGINGTSGSSGISGTNGSSGVDGTSGTSGVNGTNGTSGADGTSGSSGVSGTSGSSGVDGTSGSSGINGTSGSSGVSGSSGSSGISGTSGSSGVNGTSGTGFTWAGEWTYILEPYPLGSVVSYTGSSYLAITGAGGADTPPNDTTNWALMAEAGSNGTSGINGTSGSSGVNGTSGSSGINGTSGTSGIGSSGSSGTSGLSGVNGTSGTSATGGTQNLEQVLTVGNTTGANNILFDTGYYIVNDNILGFTNQVIPESVDGALHLTSASGTDVSDVSVNPNKIQLTTDEAIVTIGADGTNIGVNVNIQSGNNLYLNGITSGASTTYLTIDPDTKVVYYTSGSTGGSGTSGTSGVNGTSGTSGTGGGGSSITGLHFGEPLIPGRLGMFTWGNNYQQVTYSFMNERIICYPVIPEQDVPYSALTIDQGGASATGNVAKIVIYDDNGSMYPGSKRYESTSIDLSQGGCCRIHNVLTTGTLSAGTVSWVGLAISGATTADNALFAYQMNSLWNIGRPLVNDGWGVVYKYAVSAPFTNFSSLPSTFVNGGYFGFNGSWVIEGYYGGTNAAPAVYIKFSS